MEAWDRAIFALLHTTLRNPVLDILMPLVADPWSWVVPLAALWLFFLAKRGAKPAVLLLGACLVLVTVADGSATALKAIFLRPRPTTTFAEASLLSDRPASSSFPSNHATNAFALASLLAVWHRKLAFPFFAVAVLVGYSRVYTADHFPSDVVAGGLLGTALGLAAGQATRKLERRWLGWPKAQHHDRPP